MPKPVKKAKTAKKTPRKAAKPSRDPMLRARQMMAEQMEKFGTSEKPWAETEPLPPVLSFKDQLSAHMAKLGAKGGKISGAKRMEMPASKRREIAKLAATARWKKIT